MPDRPVPQEVVAFLDNCLHVISNLNSEENIISGSSCQHISVLIIFWNISRNSILWKELNKKWLGQFGLPATITEPCPSADDRMRGCSAEASDPGPVVVCKRSSRVWSVIGVPSQRPIMWSFDISFVGSFSMFSVSIFMFNYIVYSNILFD